MRSPRLELISCWRRSRAIQGMVVNFSELPGRSLSRVTGGSKRTLWGVGELKLMSRLPEGVRAPLWELLKPRATEASIWTNIVHSVLALGCVGQRLGGLLSTCSLMRPLAYVYLQRTVEKMQAAVIWAGLQVSQYLGVLAIPQLPTLKATESTISRILEMKPNQKQKEKPPSSLVPLQYPYWLSLTSCWLRKENYLQGTYLRYHRPGRQKEQIQG